MRNAQLPGALLRTGVVKKRSEYARLNAGGRCLGARVAIAALALAALQCGTSDALILDREAGVAGTEEPTGTASDGRETTRGESGSTPAEGTRPSTSGSEASTPEVPGAELPIASGPRGNASSPDSGDETGAATGGDHDAANDGSEGEDGEEEAPDASCPDEPGDDEPGDDEPGDDEPDHEYPDDPEDPAADFEPVEPPVLTRVTSRFVPPLPAEIAAGAGLVQNRDWALILGKALFWDAQVGSDGQACGSCHFNAGADSRITGQLNPGFLDQSHPGGDTRFGSDRSDTGAVAAGNMPGGAAAGPSTTLVAADFPLHRLVDETNRDSGVISDTNDVVGSIGAFAAVFTGVDAHGVERCADVQDPVFNITGSYGKKLATRQVEPRNTPTTINSAFNVRQFWDGRANNLFNGVGVFGQRDIDGDRNLRLIVASEGGSPELGVLSLVNASLASQAVGPPLSAIEMSCAGRTFADLGRKLTRLAPLAGQYVEPSDSVLGALARADGSGLAPEYSYGWLIQQAFDPKYWSVPGKFRIVDGALTEDASGYTQMETNMSMFWGIAIMMYEATLISDTSEFDQLLLSGDISMPNCVTSANVDPLLARGCKIFFRAPFGAPPADGVRGAGCAFCHAGTDLFSEAAVQAGTAFPPMLQVNDVRGFLGTRDLGFANIGIRPASVDIGLGGTDPYGSPLAFGRQYQELLLTNNGTVVKDPFLSAAIGTGLLTRAGAFNAASKLESDGSTKIPSIRNTALTPPYFSYGGYASLRQVMKFYNRGGNRRTLTPENAALEAMAGSTCTTGDSTGTGPDGNHFLPVQNTDCNTNTTGLMRPLGLSDCDANGVVTCDVASDDLSAVVRFMESLTDRRVQCDQAPFDHPELTLPHGHTASEGSRPGTAADRSVVLPAVGASGYAPSSGLCIPNSGDLFAPGMQGRVGGVRVPLAP